MDATENTGEILNAFGALLAYPEGGCAERAEACARTVEHGPGEARELLAVFSAFARSASLDELEELYTRTFDLSPVCSLEVGWHLYGEAYERGAFLAEVRGLLRQHGVAEHGELPDHLTHVLPLVARMSESESGAFARARLTPAVAKMAGGFSDEDNPFRKVIQALYLTLVAAFGEPEVAMAAPSWAEPPSGDSSESEGDFS